MFMLELIYKFKLIHGIIFYYISKSVSKKFCVAIFFIRKANFAFFSDLSKIVLIFDMLAGRLELFPILMLFHPTIWQDLFTKHHTKELQNAGKILKNN